ncbi:hypothetical protein OIC43_09110 [Streptomyces sp. NBC_00825]|uniref:hypothetical protein n=1 Tax=unclassified Streptomyces TaxID=2593676 RepID=UPI002ED091E4|nr:hypothetical protein OG832_34590 [Streptomyces sp. NBC_00826]WTH89189.1 hypothetical protein OIC43_09110 [Streptomyces sp. NBC_00825]WTH97914.1 hypothetical protein OHA23_09095 [Streptomyces sp. NBC_00822]
MLGLATRVEAHATSWHTFRVGELITGVGERSQDRFAVVGICTNGGCKPGHHAPSLPRLRDGVQQFRHAFCRPVWNESGSQIVDELNTPRRSDPFRQVECFEGIGGGSFGGAAAEVALSAVDEEDSARFVPAGWQECLAFGDESVRAGDIAEVEQAAAGVDSEIGRRHRGAPGRHVYGVSGAEQPARPRQQLTLIRPGQHDAVHARAATGSLTQPACAVPSRSAG